MNEPLTFKSKIDTWVLVVFLLTVSVAVLGAEALLGLESGYRWVGAVGVCIIGILLPLWILTYTRYELGDRYLTVHCGPFRWAVPIGEITDVSSILSASKGPALSSNRIRLEYGNGRSIVISPDNREIFLRSLEARRTELEAEPAGSS